jgi:hypothetical protein
MIMIIRREVIHFAIKKKFYRLLGTDDADLLGDIDYSKLKQAKKPPAISDLEAKKHGDDSFSSDSLNDSY